MPFGGAPLICSHHASPSCKTLRMLQRSRSLAAGGELQMAENDRSRGGAARVAVVGTGNVGSTFAYALLLSGLAAEIVLIDANRARAEGEAMDLNHAVPFAAATRIWAGDYADCA